MNSKRVKSQPPRNQVREGRAAKRRAFTLIEMLVSCTLLVLIVGMLAKIMGSTTDLWVKEKGHGSAFEAAGAAFETLTRSLSQATLNTYADYDQPEAPTKYERKSELHFILGSASSLLGKQDDVYPGSAVFFQAPLGRVNIWKAPTPELAGMRSLHSLLNSVGYFVHFSYSYDHPDFLPDKTEPRTLNHPRFRLYEWIEPADQMSVYENTQTTDWFKGQAAPDQSDVKARNSIAIADNILGMIFRVEYPTEDGANVVSFEYDSRASDIYTVNQLPPKIRVVMVAIDEDSAQKLQNKFKDDPPPVFPKDGTLFQNTAKFEEDILKWEVYLRGTEYETGAESPLKEKLNIKMFDATVNVQSSKWSFATSKKL